MIARHEESALEASRWDGFLHDAAMVLIARERVEGELGALARRPFDRAAQARLAHTLTSDEFASATAAAERILEGAPWE